MAAHRILLVAAANSTTGGGERHVADLLTGLVSRGFHCSLAAPQGGDLGDLANSLGVEMYPLPITSGVSLAKIGTLRAAMRAVNPDIVHAHGTRAAMFARLADADASRRVVYTIHGMHIDKGALSFVKMPLERYLVRRTAGFITVCDSDLRKGVDQGTLNPTISRTVHNGIAMPETVERGGFREELGLDARTPLLLHVGRLSMQKDQPTLLRAFAAMKPAVPAAVLAMVCSGADQEREKLSALARDLGIAHSIRWVAPRPNLGPAYTDADAFVLSSRWEGFPYVILEAMSHGCPVVSSDVDGIPEAIEDRVDGLLVPAGESEALGDAMSASLIRSDEALQRAAHAKSRVSSEFSVEAMVDKTVAVYDEVRARRSR